MKRFCTSFLTFLTAFLNLNILALRSDNLSQETIVKTSAFDPQNNKYETSTHLRQGLYTFFWNQKFEFLTYLKIRDFLEEK